MDIINIIDEDDEADDECQELPDVLVGSGTYQIVGIRYYSGVAHPGEFVNLVREPNNREPLVALLLFALLIILHIGFLPYNMSTKFFFLS